MELKDKEILLSALIEVSVNPKYRHNTSGICNGVLVVLHDRKHHDPFIAPYMEKLWLKWPEFSGMLGCPVKGTGCAPDYAYCTSHNMWSKIWPYGRRRWRLLRWLIATLEEEIHAEWGMRSSRVTNNIPE